MLENPTFVLFVILTLGIALGNIEIKGISLGSSGVLFVALLAGHLGYKVPTGVMGIGTALFVYCVGLGVGNRFFSALRSKGNKLVLLSVLVVGLAWLVSWLSALLLGIDDKLIAGLFAGACTSTPALAAATEAAEVVTQAGDPDSGLVNIGYGVAYPFGVIGVVLFVQLLPRLLKQSLDAPAEEEKGHDPHKIIRRVVVVTHPDIIGRNINEYLGEGVMKCSITRKVQDDLLLPLDEQDVFSKDMNLLMLGERHQLKHDAALIGHIDSSRSPRAYGDEKAEVIMLNRKMCNQTLQELNLMHEYGITVSRVSRLGNVFVPTRDTEIIPNDVLTIVGMPKDIKRFSADCGHRGSALNATDIFSLVLGVALGILIGNIRFSMGDGDGFSLGMAGGPLVVALILGHFGKIGPVVGFMPRPARVLLMEFALMLFLAGAGVDGGSKLVETLAAQGLTLFLVGAGITLVPMVVAYVLARYVFHLSLPESLGGVCGAMTSTPALGAITAKTDRQEPVIAYATAYPAALIMMTILAKLLLELLP